MQKKLVLAHSVALLISLGYNIASAWSRSVDEIRLVSTVKAPLRTAVSLIELDLVEGRRDAALKKIAILKRRTEVLFNEDGFHNGLGDIMIEFSAVELNAAGEYAISTWVSLGNRQI